MFGREEETPENKEASSYNIPTDLCEEILYRLPSNDLRNFKLVCKDWRRLISTGEYVLVLANSLRRDHRKTIAILKVYSLSLAHNHINPVLLSSSTSELETYVAHGDYVNKKIATLLHGRLHYPANLLSSKAVVLVYDFETNKIMRMSTPSIQSHIQMLGVVDGCLCAIQENVVWMMKEYGAIESWTKYAKIEGYKDGGILDPLTFYPNGDLIIIENSSKWNRCSVKITEKISSKLSRYSFKERDIKILKAYKNWIIDDCIACIDSLVSPTSLFMEDG